MQKRHSFASFIGILLSTLCLQANAAKTLPKITPSDLRQYDSAQFQLCISQLKARAAHQKISKAVIDSAFTQAKFDPNVIVYDNRQPEFSESFGNYFSKRVNKWRIEKGQKMLKTHRKLLLELQHKYGIAPHYLMSFWGLETNFGQYKGKMSTIGSLATLACDQRRSSYFTTEFITALKLIESQQLDPATMQGSWAGAMGHTQFMPSAYYQYAIDGDGDGKVDLFNSIPDALTSAANFLHNLGWKHGFRWGREVQLSDDFKFQYSGMGNEKTLSQWNGLGVSKADGSPLGTLPIKASVIVPSGHKGPAFLVYKNFDVIMRWNRSEFYAIAVGQLAERIAGNKPLVKSPIKTANLNKNHVLELQTKLTTMGFDVGKPDGIMGPATAKGIRAYQQSVKLIPDGFPDNKLFSQLGIDLTKKTKTEKDAQL